MNGQRIELAAALVGAIVLAGGCGGETSREVIVDGSSTVFRISKAAQEDYARVKPGVLVVVNNHGTSGGFGRYMEGEVDLVDASRPAKPAEEKQAGARGLPWTEFHVGYDGITVVVNPKNDFVKSLTVAQLRTLWEPGSEVKTWKDLDPTWPDRRITLYCPDNDSGTFEFFTEAIVGKARQQRKDTQASADDNVLVTGIAGDADGIGYFGYAYYAAHASELRAIPIQPTPDARPVMPDKQTILDKSYHPLARRLYIYVKNQSMTRPEVADFVAYYLKNVARLAEAGGYVAPTPDDIAANQQALRKLTAPVGKVADLSLVLGPLSFVLCPRCLVLCPWRLD